MKEYHEIRDPLHVFIRLDSDERKVLDSYPFQRLRYIHQLALSYLVYPGATHRRFEHSLGVMELAGRVFDVVTRPEAIDDKIKSVIPELHNKDKLSYWRRVLRMAALCHDMGHLPFSHAAEKDLLPVGFDHETMTGEIIRNHEELSSIWQQMTPPLRCEDIIKLAVGPKKLKGVKFTDWEAILSEIIVGDAFGVDRIDYLLRDSYHAGVAYGRFDHYRLLDTLRILPRAATDGSEGSLEPVLGIEEGGIHTAEALLLARYFMYGQVYFHPVRRIYDIHLKDFLEKWLPSGKFPTNVERFLALTDSEVITALLKASRDPGHPGHDPARRIVEHKHYKLLYKRNPADLQINIRAGEAIFRSASARFGEDLVRGDFYKEKGGIPDFPVKTKDGRIVSSLVISDTLRNIPVVAVDYVFIREDLLKEAQEWLEKNREEIIRPGEEE
ncbi:phosphohydrolases [Pelotomaculum thermopropionicum SI]|uniref:Phosphohydrolases n=1 Tax=Pelotomaculum thermopropionicum (strain DSM 13744 / JCM 10971 / SI) TaxID=370438 RepID=A5CZ38_PELTS|nr:phosphohydrolases [Pelotomaculum thermopropionicum SI]